MSWTHTIPGMLNMLKGALSKNGVAMSSLLTNPRFGSSSMIQPVATAIAGFGGLYLLYLKLFTDQAVPGITAVILTVILMGGLQVFIVGVIGQYIARIFEETKNRPLYVIDQLTESRKRPSERRNT